MIQKADRLNDVKEYYFSKKLREVAALRNEGKPIINIAIGSPDLAPSNSVIEAIQKAVILPNAHQYQSYQGIPELRNGISNFYKENYNVTLNAATEILPLMGSKEGIMHISMAFLNKGDKVLIPNPGYPTYASVTNLVEAEPILYNLSEATNWLPNFKELEQIIPPHIVCRVHKSYMVALNKIDSIERHRIYIKNEIIPISESYKTAFFTLINHK